MHRIFFCDYLQFEDIQIIRKKKRIFFLRKFMIGNRTYLMVDFNH